MEKVLLLGSTGKLGKCVLKELLSNTRYQVGVLIRNLSQRDLDNTNNLQLFEGDITLKYTLEESFEWADVVINCSGYVSYKRNDKEKLNLLNIEGVRNIVDTCSKYATKLIHTSSTSVYGCTKQSILLKENVNYENVYRTHYAYSKIEADNIVLAANIEKLILRPASLIAKGKSSINLLYTIYKKGYVAGFKGGGSFALLDDAAKAYVPALRFILNAKENQEMIFNLGGHNVSCAEIFVLFKRLKSQNSRFANTVLLRLYSIVNDFVLYPVFGYSLITMEIFSMANHFNFIDSTKAFNQLNYTLTPFESSLKEIIPC